MPSLEYVEVDELEDAPLVEKAGVSMDTEETPVTATAATKPPPPPPSNNATPTSTATVTAPNKKKKTTTHKNKAPKKITPAKATAGKTQIKTKKKKATKGQMTLGRFFAKQPAEPIETKEQRMERFQRDCTLEQQADIRKICMGIMMRDRTTSTKDVDSGSNQDATKDTPATAESSPQQQRQHQEPPQQNCVSPDDIVADTPIPKTTTADSPPSKPQPVQLAPGMEAAVNAKTPLDTAKKSTKTTNSSKSEEPFDSVMDEEQPTLPKDIPAATDTTDTTTTTPPRVAESTDVDMKESAVNHSTNESAPQQPDKPMDEPMSNDNESKSTEQASEDHSANESATEPVPETHRSAVDSKTAVEQTTDAPMPDATAVDNNDENATSKDKKDDDVPMSDAKEPDDDTGKPNPNVSNESPESLSNDISAAETEVPSSEDTVESTPPSEDAPDDTASDEAPSSNDAAESATPLKSRSSPRKKATPVSSSSSSSQPLISEERQAHIAKYKSMEDALLPRAKQLLQICKDLQDQPDLTTDKPPHGENVTCTKGTFPEFAIEQLAIRIEGQSDTLSVLAARITKELNQVYETDCFEEDATKDKIRLSASRKTYLKYLPVVDSSVTASADDSEDTQTAYLWRWECEVKELIPSQHLAKVSKARFLRKKVAAHFNSASKLLSSLAEIQKLLASKNCKQTRIDKVAARIQSDEEKFNKQEEAEQKSSAKRKRQEEEQQLKERKKDEVRRLKQKLAEEKKRQKEEKERAQKIKEQQRKAELEEKAKQKELAVQEKDRKKQEVLEAKRLKEEEDAKAEQARQAKLQKQKTLMKNFFGKAKSKKTSSPSKTSDQHSKSSTQRSTSILSQISGQGKVTPVLPIKPSEEARRHRRPRSTFVERTVYVSAEDDDDPWNQTPSYAQEKLVKIRELPKFLSFCEDVRPPYYGTWSKTSTAVSGRRPFGKDTTCFDYDYDSEAEWEEEDCELGEDLGAMDNEESSINNQAEGEVDEDDNGWLAEDDSDADEETKQMRKKMRLERTNAVTVMIAPSMGGKPFDSTPDSTDQTCLVEGIDVADASKLIQQFRMIDANNADDQFDIFPPLLMEEMGMEEDKSTPKNEMTPEMEKSFLESVHNSTLASKTMVVDEVLKKLPSMSRAGALKKLETVADKHKHPVRGFLWQVKKEALESVGLAHMADTEAAQESAKRDYLCRMARLIHNSLATSREKLEQEMLAANGEEVTRAECIRLVNQLAEKKKDTASNTTYWVIKSDKQKELGLALSQAAPAKLESSDPSHDSASTSGSLADKQSA